tara:strand:+ start:277 stop:624 length:348 start_codon:yes stop_codon:yes gene_type:complete
MVVLLCAEIAARMAVTHFLFDLASGARINIPVGTSGVVNRQQCGLSALGAMVDSPGISILPLGAASWLCFKKKQHKNQMNNNNKNRVRIGHGSTQIDSTTTTTTTTTKGSYSDLK